MIKKDLKLKVGIEIILKTGPESEEQRIVGNILGWEKDNFIVARINDTANTHLLTNNRLVLIGLVNDGFVYGFNSKIVMNVIIKGLNFCVIEYPENLEVFPLRKEERISCNLAGSFKYKDSDSDEVFKCEINDINCSGCAISTSKKLSLEDNIELSFEIPTQGEINDLNCKVANIRKKVGDNFSFGMKFNGEISQLNILESFKDFVAKVKKMIKIEDMI